MRVCLVFVFFSMEKSPNRVMWCFLLLSLDLFRVSPHWICEVFPRNTVWSCWISVFVSRVVLHSALFMSLTQQLSVGLFEREITAEERRGQGLIKSFAFSCRIICILLKHMNGLLSLCEALFCRAVYVISNHSLLFLFLGIVSIELSLLKG